MDLIDSEISEYMKSFTPAETETLKELVKISERDLEYTAMLSGPQVGKLLQMLVKITRARRILEIGTFTGYSAITMADALPDDGTIITLEMNDLYRQISRPFFERDPYKMKIRQIMGNALEIIPTLSGNFDLIFLDADKVSYPTYYKLLKDKLKKEGILIVDNIFWGGEVLRPKDEKARAIHRLNKMIRDDKEVENVMIPLRDGLSIVWKK